MSALSTTNRKPIYWALASLAAALPTLPVSRTARTAGAISIVALATGTFVSKQLSQRIAR